MMIHRNCKPVDKNLDSLNSSAPSFRRREALFPPARALLYHSRRRCWLQRAHCVCDSCKPLDLGPAVRRIYVYMHHKEILLAVDTAKIILAAYPEARLVIAGLKGQPAEAEMRAALEDGAAVVLFPSDDAAPASELAGPVDVVVIDGTWERRKN